MCDMRMVPLLGREWKKGSVVGDDGGGAREVGDGLTGDELVAVAQHQEPVVGGVSAGGFGVGGGESLLDARSIEEAEQG
jgi:hypothetical protein